MLSNVSLLHAVGSVKSNKSGLKIKLRVSTVDIQIKWLGLSIPNSKVFSSGYILEIQNILVPQKLKRHLKFQSELQFTSVYNNIANQGCPKNLGKHAMTYKL